MVSVVFYSLIFFAKRYSPTEKNFFSHALHYHLIIDDIIFNVFSHAFLFISHLLNVATERRLLLLFLLMIYSISTFYKKIWKNHFVPLLSLINKLCPKVFPKGSRLLVIMKSKWITVVNRSSDSFDEKSVSS